MIEEQEDVWVTGVADELYVLTPENSEVARPEETKHCENARQGQAQIRRRGFALVERA